MKYRITIKVNNSLCLRLVINGKSTIVRTKLNDVFIVDSINDGLRSLAYNKKIIISEVKDTDIIRNDFIHKEYITEDNNDTVDTTTIKINTSELIRDENSEKLLIIDKPNKRKRTRRKISI